MTVVSSDVSDRTDGYEPASRPSPSPAARRVQRRPGLPNGRAVLGGLLMALAALGAFWLANAGDDADMISVVVADRDLRAGDVIDEADLRLVSVDVDGEVGGLFGSVDAAVGRVVLSPVDAGEFLVSSATTDSTDGHPDAFEMTVAVGREGLPGDLSPGETVDVFSTWNSGQTELIALQAEVVDVSHPDDGLIGGGDIHVRLRLADLEQTEATVHAHNAGTPTLVRSPAAADGEIGRRFTPGGAGTQPGDTPGDGDG